MLIGPQALKSLNSIEKIQPRMMVATFNGNPSATIISCYNPTNVSEETDLIASYNELSSLVRSIPKHNILIIDGDMNAQIGKNGNYKFSLYNLSNRNREHLTDFPLENRLTCLNTKFQKKKGKLWTYTHTNNTKGQIDYVFINKKWNNRASSCEAYSTFEGVSFDHQIGTAKIRLNLWKNVTRTTTTVHYDWALVTNRNIRDKYALALRNKYNALQEKTETHTPNEGDISILNGSSLKLVDKFTYLGSSVSSIKTDINMWLAKAWIAIDRLLIIWKSDLTDKMKRSFFQAAVVLVLLYGCQLNIWRKCLMATT